MQTKEGITKEQSTMLQGVAILLMMFHHFFLSMDFCPFTVVHVDWVLKFAWFGKICVGIFAFVSGYGMYYVMQRVNKEHFFPALGKGLQISFRKIISLYLKFWFILFLTKGVDLIFFDEVIDLIEFIKNMFTISISYNGSIWYLQQYVQMMIILPFLDLFFTSFEKKQEQNKKRIFYVSCVAAVCILAVTARFAYRPLWEFLKGLPEKLRLAYTAVFVVGYFVARFSVFHKLNGKVEKCPVLLQVLLGMILIGLVVAVRIQLATDAAYATMDFILAPILIYGLLLFVGNCKVLGKILYPLGICSTYMWFLHGWMYVKTFVQMVNMHLYTLQFYLIQVCIDFVVALVLVGIERWVRKRIHRK